MVDVIKELHEETQVNEIDRDLEDKIQLIEEARDKLQAAYDKIEEALSDINGQPATYIKAYFLDKLEIMISSDHGFLTNDPTIDTIIKDVREYYEEEDDEDEDESVKEDKEEKPKFDAGEKVKNPFGEILTIVKKDGDEIYVEEQPNIVYKAADLTKYVNTEEVVKDEDKS